MDETFFWLPFLLQTADALFPTGAYAHSSGFEEGVRLGVVTSEPSLGEFLLLQIVPALENLELPYLRFSYEAAQAGDFEELCAIDREINAWKLAYETRLASVQLGVRRLKALRIFSDAPILGQFAAGVETRRIAGHHLIVSALQACVSGIPLGAALVTFFYQALAAVCAAALKLIRIGQEGCQRVLHRATREAEAAVARSLTVARPRAGWFNPLLEIASMRHERAEERLFIS